MTPDPRVLVRRYLRSGFTAHLLEEEPTKWDAALCGRRPRWDDDWRGTGSQAEYDVASRLPLCKRCEALS